MKMKKLAFIVSLALASSVASLSAGKSDIVDTAVKAGQFKTLAAALGAADLVDALKGDGPFTVFAPTDAAFAKLPEGTVETLLKPENKQKLADILTYHVVSGNVPAKVAVTLDSAKALNKKSLALQVKGSDLYINDSKVVKADIETSNGVIHVIDSVLLPPADAKDIVDTAVGAGQFKTLAAALGAADLVGALKGKGPFTVFAPTDAAFAKLPKGTVESLLKPENKGQLVDILTYHVVSGNVPSNVAVTLDKAVALNKKEIMVSKKSRGLFLNDAKVVKTDIECSNGVIHVIDSVLLPPKAASVSETASNLIHAAIAKGAPLFNHGNHEACAAVYEVTAHALMELPKAELPKEMRTKLKHAIKTANKSSCATTDSWTYREVFDQMTLASR